MAVSPHFLHMPDLVLRLSPDPRYADELVRGVALADAGPVVAVYDFLDCVGFHNEHRHDKKRKRGPFSRDTWARLTYLCAQHPSRSAPFAAALRALVVDAPIRASAKVARMTLMPCVPLHALRTLMQAVVADLRTTYHNSDSRIRDAAKHTIDSLDAGDRSMIGTLVELPGKRKRVHREDALDAKKPASSDIANNGAQDVLLRLTNGTVVEGTTTPNGSAKVFSVYNFIDVVGSQLNAQPKSRMWSRYFWKRLITWKYKHEFCHDTDSLSVRCNAQSNRRHITPVLPMERLHRVLHFVYRESQKQDGPGLRSTIPRNGMERETRQELEDVFEKYFKGDHSMIEICE